MAKVTNYICDKCGAEFNDREDVHNVVIKHTSYVGATHMTMDFCPTCADAFQSILNEAMQKFDELQIVKNTETNPEVEETDEVSNSIDITGSFTINDEGEEEAI